MRWYYTGKRKHQKIIRGKNMKNNTKKRGFKKEPIYELFGEITEDSK
jgi:hypothetical protein